MIKTVKFFFSLLLAIAVVIPAGAQTFRHDSLYGPLKQEKDKPESISKRLSYENFRNIKLLHAALMNFGGGDTEIDKLVNEYSDASAFYFEDRMKEAADMFKKNQLSILNATKTLAQKYNDDTRSLLLQGVKLNVKHNLKRKLEGIAEKSPTDKHIDYARGALQKARDLFTRFKDVPETSSGTVISTTSRNLITAIYYYRIAKDNLLTVIKHVKMDEAQRDELLARYKKDEVDNKNKIFVTKEKKN